MSIETNVLNNVFPKQHILTGAYISKPSLVGGSDAYELSYNFHNVDNTNRRDGALTEF